MDVTDLLKTYLTPTDPPLDLAEALALGLLGDSVRTFHVCGVGNTNTSWQDLWGPGGIRVLPSDSSTVAIASTDGTDRGNSSGARRVEVVGWDNSWNLAAEEVMMQGTGTATTTGKFQRVISARVSEAGASGVNAGTLSFSISSQTMATIEPGDNASLHSHFTVPANHVAYVYDWRFSAAKGGGQIDHGAIRFYHAPMAQPHYPREQHAVADGVGLGRSGPLLIADQESELVVRAQSSGAGAERLVATSYRVALFPAV